MVRVLSIVVSVRRVVSLGGLTVLYVYSCFRVVSISCLYVYSCVFFSGAL